MELLLWRWSTLAQIASTLTIAVFFVVLARSVRRVELRPWVQAWLANLGAMGVATVFWIAQPKPDALGHLLGFGYLFAKTMFVALLAIGAWTFVRGTLPRVALRWTMVAVAVYSFIGTFALTTMNHIGLAGSIVMSALFVAAAALLLVKRVPGAAWLAAGLALRGALAAVAAAAYWTRVVPTPWSSSKEVGIFLAAHSSFDTAAEWVIALGCVLTVYRTIHEELTRSNAELLAAQEVLQDLVDRDPLTGLANRRVLPVVLRESFGTGGTILFFDLNDFKDVNDLYGHKAGDECLLQFAAALRASFRPQDHVIRYAGDEFVVVAPGASPEQLLARVETMRERLKFDRAGAFPIRFSVGHAVLPPHGEPEEALRAADEAMYRDKAQKTVKMRAVR